MQTAAERDVRVRVDCDAFRVLRREDVGDGCVDFGRVVDPSGVNVMFGRIVTPAK
tara:strand:+ start:132 stop:296 length:165 start_codon:yes stop_codon:yes gene_type:complete